MEGQDNRPGPEPEPEPEPEEIMACDDGLEDFFEDSDINGDGMMNADEFRRSGAPGDVEFNDIDISGDGLIEFTEVLAFVCTCENELDLFMEQLPDKTATEFFASLPFKNDIDIEALDMNKDDYVDFTEIEKAMATCTTTYNPFDSDGDGIPDIDDQFPDDPSESKDADGDGIGDNADFAPSVANDMLYGAGGAILIVLIGLLVLLARGEEVQDKTWTKIGTRQMRSLSRC